MLQEHLAVFFCIALLTARLLLGARRFNRLELRSLLTTVAVLAFVTEAVARPYVVPTGSMRPTIVEGDHILGDKLDMTLCGPHRGEIVVLHSPESGINLCKRVVGLAGDHLAIHDGRLWLNGQPVEEPYLNEPIEGDMADCEVPRGKVFVMGDNRNNSHDSRAYGAVPVSALSARVTTLLRRF